MTWRHWRTCLCGPNPFKQRPIIRIMGGYDLVCIGDSFCDVIAGRIPLLPKPNEQARTDVFLVRGGESANTAAAAARLGLRTAFVGKVGNDLLGDWFVSRMGSCGVDAFISRDRRRATAVTLALSIGKADRRFVSDPGANAGLGIGDFDLGLLGRAKHVLRGGFWHTPRLFAGNRGIFRAAKEAGCSTSLNMGWDYGGWTPGRRGYVYSCLPFVDFLFLNDRELSALAGSPQRLVLKGAGSVVVHRGEDGCRIVSGNGSFSAPAFKARVVNPVGAGDVFNAGFIYGALRGWDVPRTVEFANAAAALHISGKDFLPRARDVRNFVKKTC